MTDQTADRVVLPLVDGSLITEDGSLDHRGPIERFIVPVALVALCAILIHTLVNAVSRTLFNHPIEGTLEYVQYWYMPVIVSMGLVLASLRREHIIATLVLDKLTPRTRAVFVAFGATLMLITAALFAWFGFGDAVHAASINKTGGVVGVVVWPAMAIPPICFALVAAYAAREAFTALSVVAGRQDELPGWTGSPVTVAGMHDDIPALTHAAARPSPLRSAFCNGAPLVWTAIMAALTVAIFLPITPEWQGVCALCLAVALILVGVPVGPALTVPGLLGLFVIIGPLAPVSILTTVAYNEFASWSLSVFPMFVLMGLLLWQSGLTSKLYRAAEEWLNWLPGGIGVATTGAGAVLSSVTGSTAAMMYALTRIGIPEMLRAGYDKKMALGTVMIAGLPGQLIPPSIILVIYSGLSGTPIGPQLVAGVIPGVVVAVLSMTQIVIMAKVRPSLVGDDTMRRPSNWKRRAGSLPAILPFPVLMVVVIGGMFTGFFTPTEAGAVGAALAIMLIAFTRHGKGPLRAVITSSSATVASVGSIFFLLVGSVVISRMINVSGLGPKMTKWIIDLNLNPTVFLLAMAVIYFLLGIALEPLAIMLLTVPLLVPALEAMNISLILFGVLTVFMAELAVISPPVGLVLFIVAQIVKDPRVGLGHNITLGDVFGSVLWFLPTMTIMTLLIIVYPSMSLWLPGLMG